MSYNALYSKKASKSVKVYDFNTLSDNLSSQSSANKPPVQNKTASRVADNSKRPSTAQKTNASNKNKPVSKTNAVSAKPSGAQYPKREARRDISKNTEIKIRTIKAPKRSPFPIAVVFMSIISTVLFMYMIFNMVQINEVTQDISSMQSQLSNLKTEANELTLELEKKNDLNAIEEYAVNVLGMVKMDQLPKKYVSIDNEEKVEVVKPEPEESTGPVSTIMSAITENFRNVFGIN